MRIFPVAEGLLVSQFLSTPFISGEDAVLSKLERLKRFDLWQGSAGKQPDDAGSGDSLLVSYKRGFTVLACTFLKPFYSQIYR
jgi:hypothetical protein